MDVRQSPLWAEYLNELGWTVVKIDSNYAYLKKIPFVGKLIKIPRADPFIDLSKIDKLAKTEKALFVKLEPLIETKDPTSIGVKRQLVKGGFREDKWTLAPSKTIVIDLSKKSDDLLKWLEKDTRYSLRMAERNGVLVKETNDLDNFRKMYKDTARRKGFWVAEKELTTVWQVFTAKNAAKILTAYSEGEELAKVLLLFSQEKGYYFHAASTQKGRRLLAPYLLLWRGMLLAKKLGCKEFDLEGIFDPRIPSTKNWKGFTLFKRGFGGREVEFVGSFTKIYNPVFKLLSRISRF